MLRGTELRRVVALAATAAMWLALILPASADVSRRSDLYVPPPNQDARKQIAQLVSEGRLADAAGIRDMIRTPQAVWFTAGTPESVQRDVRQTMHRARAKRSIPVLVAYNIPFRDCAQFSAGGATTVEEYEAWIDGFAAGMGRNRAIVILEPDGLGIIPWYTSVDGVAEWCQPAEADPATAASDRFEMLQYAVETLGATGANVYLDGTHSAWLNVGDIATRLRDAGVEDAAGFFLNASNYQFTDNQVAYGSWISACIEMLAQGAAAADCANQYWNGGPEGTAIADLLGPWTGVALSSYGVWSESAPEPELNTSGVEARYAGVEAATHFVVDTSRNGVGPWQPGDYPDFQDWCNPPDRGLGLQPTLHTGTELVDAFLWVKIPGESDGECTRGLGPAGETVDPEWGIIDPPAGEWFPAMALDLVHNAVE